MMCLLECQSQLGWRDPTRSRNLYQFPFGGLVCRQSSSARDFGVWSTLIPTLNPGAGIIECEKLAALSGTRTHALLFHQVLPVCIGSQAAELCGEENPSAFCSQVQYSPSPGQRWAI